MPALLRRSGMHRLLIAALVLGLVPASVEAMPRWTGHGDARSHHAAKHAAVARARTAPKAAPTTKPEPQETAAAKPGPSRRTGTWTAAEGERACFRSRRKLWQDGQGWIVKKVSVCP